MEQMSPEEVHIRIQRIQQILQDFQQEMGHLRDQKHEIIEKILQRINEEQIQQILKDIHHDGKKD